ncbi:MAG: flippase-like domain-containing protein, partial [Leptolyngbya sp. SIO1D8]|nr:flippase-like domain-containing protein [Leptolyngbya sp. SIO1D8]
CCGLVLGLLLLGSRKFADIFFSTLIGLAPKKMKEKLQKLQLSWNEMHDYFWSDKAQLLKVSLTSVFIWSLHLLQIWFFILALKAWAPFLVNLALSPLAILAGLLPLTFAGVGTRDAALILFYQPYFDEITGAALGLLCTSRYFLPAIGGLPFLGKFLSVVRK